jgi:hypothetical protein
MADEYPRLLADRDVVVLRDGQPEQTRLRGWLDGHDGPVSAYRVELVGATPTRVAWRETWAAECRST